MINKSNNILTLICKGFILLVLSTSIANAVCGNGKIDAGEVCDLGSANNGNPSFGCNATCTEIFDGWKCNGDKGNKADNLAEFNKIYDGMIALYDKIRAFDNAKCRAADKFPFNMDNDCYTYEIDLRNFISVNQSTPINCATVSSKNYTTPKKLTHNDGTFFDVKFEPGC